MSPWAPLRHRVFAALFAAQLGSHIGTFFQSIAAAWLMGDLSSSPTLVALIPTASLLPVLLLGVPAGALADIIDRRLLLVGTQLWMLLCAAALAALTFVDAITPGTLLALTFALGVGTALMGPAWQAIQPDLVPTDEFTQAVALSSLTFNTGRAIGPALAGGLVAAAGAEWAFLVNATSFLGVVTVLLWWHPPRPSLRLPAETLAGAVRAGLRYGANSLVFRTVLVRTALFVVPAAGLQALLPIVVRGPLELSSGGYGVLLGCFGLGAVAAATVRPRLDAALSTDQLVVVASCVLAGGLVIDGLVDQSWIIGLSLFVSGGAWTTAAVSTNVSAQRALPWWVRARGLGLYMLVMAGGVAVGAAIWGAIAAWSITGAHLIASASLLVGVVVGRRHRLRWAEEIDLRPAAASDPMVTLVPRPTDGPVLITVAYRVPAEHHADFADAMRVVERDRRRRGAYRWGLFRDLAAPDRFVETFVVDSWAEHLRQHQRRTVSTDLIAQRARSFVDHEVAVAHYVSAYSEGGLDQVEELSPPELPGDTDLP
jgi:MFS family permease